MATQSEPNSTRGPAGCLILLVGLIGCNFLLGKLSDHYAWEAYKAAPTAVQLMEISKRFPSQAAEADRLCYESLHKQNQTRAFRTYLDSCPKGLYRKSVRDDLINKLPENVQPSRSDIQKIVASAGDSPVGIHVSLRGSGPFSEHYSATVMGQVSGCLKSLGIDCRECYSASSAQVSIVGENNPYGNYAAHSAGPAYYGPPGSSAHGSRLALTIKLQIPTAGASSTPPTLLWSGEVYGTTQVGKNEGNGVAEMIQISTDSDLKASMSQKLKSLALPNEPNK